MEWYEAAYEQAEEEHDPADYGGREWHELTDEERNDAVYEGIYGRADALVTESKHG